VRRLKRLDLVTVIDTSRRLKAGNAKDLSGYCFCHSDSDKFLSKESTGSLASRNSAAWTLQSPGSDGGLRRGSIGSAGILLMWSSPL